jgi:hypothetical protein
MTSLLHERLSGSGIEADVVLSRSAVMLEDRPTLAITSSRLGKSTHLHAAVCRYIRRSMMDARCRGQVVLIASGSAIEPWAARAAELFSVPMVTLRVNEPTKANALPGDQATISVTSAAEVSRDAVVVALADRVDCVFARPNGVIASSLETRLSRRPGPTIRVAVHPHGVDRKSQIAARALMDRGAIGWYCGGSDPPEDHTAGNNALTSNRTTGEAEEQAALVSSDWAENEGEWIVHCTRGCSGPWPGQSERQHRDTLLLNDHDATGLTRRTPLDSLTRILRMRRIVGSARATGRDRKVVCFSAQPLRSLLALRCYRSHLHRWDYEPYGVAIRKSAAIAIGIRAVIYGSSQDRENLSAVDRYRFQAIGKTYDWRQEREWRCAGDVALDRLNSDDIRVFVRDQSEAVRLPNVYPVSAVGALLR